MPQGSPYIDVTPVPHGLGQGGVGKSCEVRHGLTLGEICVESIRHTEEVYQRKMLLCKESTGGIMGDVATSHAWRKAGKAPQGNGDCRDEAEV